MATPAKKQRAEEVLGPGKVLQRRKICRYHQTNAPTEHLAGIVCFA